MLPCLALSKNSKPIVSQFPIFVLTLLTLSLVFLLSVGKAYPGQATLSWDPPTTNADGTPLTDLSGYKVYYGATSGNYSQIIDVSNVTTYTVANLTAGLTYYFAATAYDTSGNESGYSNEVSKTISSTQQYTLNITKGGTGSGTVTSSPAGISCGSVCSYVYNAGTVVTLTASPDTSSTFTGWSGGCTGTWTCTVTMVAAKAVTATFTEDTYPDISVTPSSYNFGKVVIGDDPVRYIFAVTNIGTANLIINTNKITGLDASEFFLFDDNCSGRTLIPSDKCTVSVVFSPVSVGSKNANLNIPSNDPSTPIVNIQLSGSGVAESTSSIDLPKTGQTISYVPGDDGYIQAGNDWPNPRFTNNGDGTVTDNLTGLIWLKDAGCIKNSWSNALNAIADFNNKPGNYNCLEYAAKYFDWRLPNVKELESLINYGDLDSAARLNSEGFVDVKSSYYWSSTTYPSNALQAWVINMTKGDMIPAIKNYNYYIFPVRSGNAGGGQPAQQYTLTVNKSWTGSGTVTSSPAGISCGADCTYAYNAGTVVTLSASPAASSTFAGWSGGGCTGTGTCTLTMDAAKAVTATFTLTTTATTYNLSVTKTGTGSGTVTSRSAGINCGADCSETYNAGTVVTLTASPAASSTFAGWSGGGCAGAGTCTVTMNAAKAVTAIFNYIIKGQ